MDIEIYKYIVYVLSVNIFTGTASQDLNSTYRCYGQNFAGEVLCSQPLVIQVNESFYGLSTNDPGCSPRNRDCTAHVHDEYSKTISEACDGKHKCSHLLANQNFCEVTATNYVIIYFLCVSDISNTTVGTTEENEQKSLEISSTTVGTTEENEQKSLVGIAVAVPVVITVIIIVLVIFTIIKRRQKIQKENSEDNTSTYCDIDATQKMPQNGGIATTDKEDMYSNGKIQKQNGKTLPKYVDILHDAENEYNTIGDTTKENMDSNIKRVGNQEAEREMNHNTVYEHSKSHDAVSDNELVDNNYYQSSDVQQNVENNEKQTIIANQDNCMMENTYYESSGNRNTIPNNGMVTNNYYQSSDVQQNQGNNMTENTYYESTDVNPQSPTEAKENVKTMPNNLPPSTDQREENYYDPPLTKSAPDVYSENYGGQAHKEHPSDGQDLKAKDGDGNYVYVYGHFAEEGRERSPPSKGGS